MTLRKFHSVFPDNHQYDIFNALLICFPPLLSSDQARKWRSASTVDVLSRLLYVCSVTERCLFIHISNYECESKSNDFFFITGIITNTGTRIIHQNEAVYLWITFLLLNIVPVSLNSNVPPSNKGMNPCLVKFCWRFFELFHYYSFHFLVAGILLAS